MAITRKYINRETAALKTFLEDSGLFDSVTVSDDTISCYDADNNLLFTINNNSSYGNVIVRMYIDANTYQEQTLNGNITYGYKSANQSLTQTNGIMLRVYYSYSSASYNSTIAFAKTNNNKVACICSIHPLSGISTATNHKTFWALAWGDVVPLSSLTFETNTRNQAVIVNFITCNDLNVSSYTPNAGYLPIGQYYSTGYGTMVIGDDTYLTNGYWVIKDA